MISPPVDVVEDHDGYRFSHRAARFEGDSLEVKVEDETLVINAERSEPAWAKDARVHRAERHYGRIHRAFRLPGDVGHDAIKAAYKDGVLEVAIAKRPEAKAVRVEVAYSNRQHSAGEFGGRASCELTRIIHRPVNEKATDTLRICY